ncbi:single-stranded-DNA-specific exonuclease RecJ, partial [bacterium]|nr:single-stranded-DNA-specific exonuclease RecJ [bacterium]
ATAVILEFLRYLDLPYDYILPHRVKDGYGLHVPAVERIQASGAGLLLTVDNGTTAHAALSQLAELKIDVIVLDHHQQDQELPCATAIVNANRNDSQYPFKGLAGVGVAWKLLQALEAPDLDRYLDLFTIGTIGDMVPMLGENRLLVRRGLEQINRSPRPGIRALRHVTRLQDRVIDAGNISWMLAPQINSAGRMANPDIALELLRARNMDEAMPLANQLSGLNEKRKAEQQKGLEELLNEVQDNINDCCIVQRAGDWHLGIIGLIAARISQEFSLPSIIFSRVGGGRLKASSRSIPGFDITAAIARQSHLLEEFGGHSEAAGLTIREENLEQFIAAMEEFARGAIDDEMRIPQLSIDLELQPAEIGLHLLDELRELTPWGMGNPRPRFLLQNSRLLRKNLLTNGKHLKLHLENGGREFEAIWWQQGPRGEELQYGSRLDVVFQLQSNSWNGRTKEQLIIDDIRY